MKTIHIFALTVGLALLAGCASPQPSNQAKGAGQQSATSDWDVTRAKLPQVHVEGWIDSQNIIAVHRDDSEQLQSSGLTKYDVLRCSNGHDYLLMFVNSDMEGVTYASGRDNTYAVGGGVATIPAKISEEIEALKSTINPATGTREARDVSYMILVSSLKKIK